MHGVTQISTACYNLYINRYVHFEYGENFVFRLEYFIFKTNKKGDYILDIGV